MQVPAAEIPNTPGSRMPNWMSGVSRQESSGIGILFDRVSLAGPFTIQVVIPGSAAALCGRIAAGDMLHGVGKTPVYELDQQQAVALLRGQAGSDITLWMSQAPTDGEPRPPVKEVKVKRNSVNHSYANAAECESRTSVESQRILPDWIHHLLVHSPSKL